MPRHFVEDDRAAVVEMVRAAALGHVVAAGADGLVSTPMPVLIDDDGTTVRGHLARANPILRSLPTDALLIVPGRDAYVSPSWYPSKQEHGRVVPTWNYEVVHLRGRLVAHDDEWTLRLVGDLTDLHEGPMERPWSVDDAPPGYVDQLLRGIVGVSLRVERIDAKRKLGQNRSDADAFGAADGLERLGGDDRRHVAAAMRRHRPDPGDA